MFIYFWSPYRRGSERASPKSVNFAGGVDGAEANQNTTDSRKRLPLP